MIARIARALRSRAPHSFAPLALGVALAACQDASTPSAPEAHAEIVGPACGPVPCQLAPPKILFSRYVDRTYMIYSVKADGTGLTFLGQGSQPTWSPDFKKVAFTPTPLGGGIYTMNADGTGRTQITFGQYDTDPSWSADGTTIAFAGRTSTSYDIHFVPAGGGQPTRLAANDLADERSPSWSPNGTQIVATIYTANIGNNLIVLDVVGNGGHVLSGGPVPKRQPTWSPDGTKIAFTINVPGVSGCGIMVVSPNGFVDDGLGATPFAPPVPKCGSPSWSTDSKSLAFSMRLPNGTSAIGRALLDGSGFKQVTSGFYVDDYPSFSRN